MTRPRDSQRQKVWDAEHEARRNTSDNLLLALNNIRPFTKNILNSRWADNHMENYLPKQLDIYVGRSGSCCAWINRHGELQLPAYSHISDKLALLHAVAHVFSPEDKAWHGPEFCRTYLEMTGRFISSHAADQLRASFKTHRIKLKTMSPEAREAARKRYVERENAKFPDELLDILRRRRNG
jgi:hypothetical protein